jgi:DNA-binding transcriptional MerR regulator
MKEKSISGLMKIGGVAKAAGVSISTIHYYVQERLLEPPVKTSRNMAYYEPQAVEEIKLIQELQTKKFLPLSAIKLILKAKREGQDINHISDMKAFMEEIFQPGKNEVSYKSVSLSELTTAAALPESSIKDLEKKGLIVPIKTKHGTAYSYIDILIAQTVKKLTDYGLQLSDLDIFGEQIESVRKEARAMHEAVHRIPNHEQVPLREMLKAVNDLNSYLMTRVLREEAGQFHEHDEHL